MSIKDKPIDFNASAPQFYPVVLFAVETGCRRGEILNLKWADVDLAQKTIVMRKTKSGKSRTVIISERITAMLRELKIRGMNEFVFVNRDSKPYKDLRSALKHSMIRSGLSEERRRLGKPELHFHDLRHCAAVLYAEATGDIYLVAEQLGHSTIEMRGRYVHVSDKRRRDAVQSVSDTINGTKLRNYCTIADFGKKPEQPESEKSLCFTDVFTNRAHSSVG